MAYAIGSTEAAIVVAEINGSLSEHCKIGRIYPPEADAGTF